MGTDIFKKPSQEQGEEQEQVQKEKSENKEQPMTPEQFEGAVDAAKETVTGATNTGIEGAKISFTKVSEGVDEGVDPKDKDLVKETTTALAGVEQNMLVLRDTTRDKINAAGAEALETKEAVEPVEIPKEIADKLITDMLKKVREAFDAPQEDIDRLDFHNTKHTEGVIRRAEEILLAIQGENPNEEEVKLAEIIADRKRALTLISIIAAGHDLKQEYGVDKTGGKEMRKRSGESKDAKGNVVENIPLGTNEKESAEAVIRMMKAVNQEQGKEIFSAKDFETAKEAIDATVVVWNDELKTAIQPSLTSESSAIARALALADIGVAGMDPKKFVKGENEEEKWDGEGDPLFCEENLDMWNLKIADLKDDQKEAYRQRMLGWSKLQVGFAEGRQKRLEKEIAGLPEDAQKRIKELFTDANFEKSIAGAQAKLDARAKMTFEELYKDMGFKAKAAV